LYLDNLSEDYTQIKNRIATNLDQLKDTLDTDQFNEIHESLNSKYKQAALKPRTEGRPAPTRGRAEFRPPQRSTSQRARNVPPRRREPPMRGNNKDLVGQIMALITNRYQ
jgi:hypothetical protein